MLERANYSPLLNKDLDKIEGTQLEGDCTIHTTEQARRRRNALHWILHFLSAVTIAALLIWIRNGLNPSQAKCWDMFNYYSCAIVAPVNNAVVPHPYVAQEFNGSLWYQTPFTGPPTPDVERAWYEVMKYGMISISKNDIEKIGHPDWSAQFPSEIGGGYIAATIGTHQLHCLHWIWQDHYIDAVPTMQQKKKTVPEMYERHYEHCVNYIRQSLMCQFDTGVIPYNWVLDHQNPTPNANTHHKCVDWDALQAWLRKRRVEVPDDFQWSQPEDAKTLNYNP